MLLCINYTMVASSLMQVVMYTNPSLSEYTKQVRTNKSGRYIWLYSAKKATPARVVCHRL